VGGIGVVGEDVVGEEVVGEEGGAGVVDRHMPAIPGLENRTS
jgi:hypothetical protein